MSRSGYSDDCGGWDLICWRGAARWYCSGPVRRRRHHAVVAMQKSILCELNPKYGALAERRNAAAWLDGAAQMDVFHDSALDV